MARSKAQCHPDRALWANGLCSACHQRAYREANRDRINARRRELGQLKTVASGKKTRKSPGAGLDVARRTESVRAYTRKNRERLRASNNAWYAAHPEYKRAKNHRRKARLRDLRSPGVTPQEWAQVLEYFGNVCAYCLRSDRKLERDHVEPISRGGLDSPGNVVPACHECNTRKAARTLLVFLPLQQRAA